MKSKKQWCLIWMCNFLCHLLKSVVFENKTKFERKEKKDSNLTTISCLLSSTLQKLFNMFSLKNHNPEESTYNLRIHLLQRLVLFVLISIWFQAENHIVNSNRLGGIPATQFLRDGTSGKKNTSLFPVIPLLVYTQRPWNTS